MNTPLHCLAVLGLFAGLTAPAFAAPEDDYVVYRAAAAINAACGGLKYLEHRWALAGAAEALNETRQNRMSLDGRMPEADYEAWLAGLDAKVDAAVSAVGCTQQAMQYINQAKGRASGETYIGLVLAVHFSGQHDVLQRMPMRADRMTALQRYDGYLQAVYGQSFAAFSEQHKQLATQKLPAINMLESGLGAGMGLVSEADLEAIRNAQSLATEAVRSVVFEVTAETAGFLVRPRTVDVQWTIPDLRPATAPLDPGYIVIDGPRRDFIDLTADITGYEELDSILTLTPQNTLRVMYYGDAAELVEAGTARLYVPRGPAPEGVTDYSFFNDPRFRDGAAAFEGTPVASGCLGTACFDFPPEATAAFIAPETGQYAEIFVSPTPGAEPVRTERPESLKAGRVSPFYARKLLAQ